MRAAALAGRRVQDEALAPLTVGFARRRLRWYVPYSVGAVLVVAAAAWFVARQGRQVWLVIVLTVGLAVSRGIAVAMLKRAHQANSLRLRNADS